MDKLGKLQQQIFDIFGDRFEMKISDPHLDLLESGIVDSVKIVELVLELEQRFGVSLPFEDLEIEDFQSVAKLAACVARTAPAAA